MAVAVQERARESACVSGPFRLEFAVSHFPVVGLNVAIGAPPPTEKLVLMLHRRLVPAKEACGSISFEDQD